MSFLSKLAERLKTSPTPLAEPARIAPLPAGPFVRFPPRAAPAKAPWMAALPDSDLAALAAIGTTVRDRLAADPAAEALPAQGLDIFAVADFLSAEECAGMIALVDADVAPSVSLSKNAPQRRTSYTCRLPAEAPLVAAVEARIAALLGVPLDHSETVQGQRYAPGQQFKMHNDFFGAGQPSSQVVADEGGQRTWTAMIYLNEPEKGGATRFPHAGIACRPRAGLLLTWNNLGPDGLGMRASLHEGAMVESGVKHVLTKWFRERAWQGSERSDAMRT